MKKLLTLLVFTVFISGCTTTSSISSTPPIAEAKSPNQKLFEIRKEYIIKYLKTHPNVSAEIKNAMLSAKVISGMDKEQVIAVVNKPSEIQPDSVDKTKEAWIFSGSYLLIPGVTPRTIKDVYFYFKDGILQGWENQVQKNTREYLQKHPKLAPEIKNALLEGKFFIGMDKEQIKVLFGEPENINRTVTKNVVSEQWIYGNLGYGEKYLYFKNGILESWQD